MFQSFTKFITGNQKIEQDDNKINIMILDSASGTPEDYYEAEYSKIVEYLTCEVVDKYKFNQNQTRYLKKSIRKMILPVPKQYDGHSCGLFLLMYIEGIISDR